MGDRFKLNSFWETKADDPSVKTMMLNNDADKIDNSDRWDVMRCLPDFSNKRVVELGAGIGRFTQLFAPKAKSVYVSDFIANYVEENKKENNRYGNCEFHVESATAIERQPNSADFVFTNWLLMYLTDDETVDFFNNVLSWLTVDGYFHFRESCSESSKGKQVGNEPGDEKNPTHYRHICQYINLLKKIVLHDSVEKKRFGFRILWAKSIPTYIAVFNNWRQIHMLLQKVELIEENGYCNGVANGVDPLLNVLTKDTLREQDDFNRSLSVIEDSFSSDDKLNGILNIVPDPNFSVSPFEIVEDVKCVVVDVESCAYSFNNLLAEANEKCNKSVLLNWLENFDKKDDWYLPMSEYEIITGCNVLKSAKNCHQLLLNLKSYLAKTGSLLLLEEFDSADFVKQQFQEAGFEKIETLNVENELRKAFSKAEWESVQKLPIKHALYGRAAASKWFLIKAALNE